MLTAEINIPQLHPTPLLMDNDATLALAKDPHFHAHTKHINICWHYIHECIDDSHIYFSYSSTANIFMKPRPTPAFLCLRSFLGLCNLP
jgi:hypothetical protein